MGSVVPAVMARRRRLMSEFKKMVQYAKKKQYQFKRCMMTGRYGLLGLFE